jgi:hypothetical protein
MAKKPRRQPYKLPQKRLPPLHPLRPRLSNPALLSLGIPPAEILSRIAGLEALIAEMPPIGIGHNRQSPITREDVEEIELLLPA